MRRGGGRAAFTLAAALLAAVPAGAPSSPDEHARGLLQDGRAYMRAGKTKQALDNFNTIESGFPGTDSVDDALLELGRHHMEAGGEPDKARAAFEQVAKSHPQSHGAPGAYYYQGLLTLNRATTAPEIEDALAQFARVETALPPARWK